MDSRKTTAQRVSDLRRRFPKTKSSSSGLQSRFSTVCPQCSKVIHAASSTCDSCGNDMKAWRQKKKIEKQAKNLSLGQHKQQHNHIAGIWTKITEYMEQLHGAGYACVLLYSDIAKRQRSHYGFRCSIPELDASMAKPLGRALVNGFQKVVKDAFPLVAVMETEGEQNAVTSGTSTTTELVVPEPTAASISSESSSSLRSSVLQSAAPVLPVENATCSISSAVSVLGAHVQRVATSSATAARLELVKQVINTESKTMQGQPVVRCIVRPVITLTSMPRVRHNASLSSSNVRSILSTRLSYNVNMRLAAATAPMPILTNSFVCPARNSLAVIQRPLLAKCPNTTSSK